MVEASPRTKMARQVTIAAMAAGVVGSGPWTGWWTLALLVPAGVLMVSLEHFIGTAKRPEFVSLLTLLAMLGVLAAAAAGTGGSDSPVLAWLAIPPATAALRFRWAVQLAVAGLATALMLGVAVLVDPVALAADPVQLVTSMVLLASMVAVTTALMHAEMENRDRAVTDPLTGLLNRSSLQVRVAELEEQARVTGAAVSLAVLDIDHFKRVNDVWGHERGDAVLRDVARDIRRAVRSFELVYRIGGEEFLVLMPGVGLDEAVSVAERIRAEVEAAPADGLELTVSAGVATAAGRDVRYDGLFGAADAALLQVKRAGRNRVVVAGRRSDDALAGSEPTPEPSLTS